MPRVAIIARVAQETVTRKVKFTNNTGQQRHGARVPKQQVYGDAEISLLGCYTCCCSQAVMRGVAVMKKARKRCGGG